MSGKNLIQLVQGSTSERNYSFLESKLDKILSEAREQRPFLGWVRLPDNTRQIQDIKKWASSLEKSQKTLAVFGIGGSALGAKAAYDFLNPKKTIYFFDNIDGFSFEQKFSQLELKKTHFLIISKSGETSETLFQLAHLLELLQVKKLKAKKHITVITEDKLSTLTKLSEKYQLRRLNVPADVGGRYSVLSVVGLAPLFWAGISVDKILEGARWARGQKKLVCELVDFYLSSFRREEWVSVFWFYVDGLKTFGLWLEQLWAESLAKIKTREQTISPRVSTPKSCLGATDQHSLLQQFVEGSRDKSFLFISSEQSETSKKLTRIDYEELAIAKNRSVGELLKVECEATQHILNELNISTKKMKILKQTPETLGALFFVFEILVATLGECLDINAFDQPGVEGVKQVTLGTLGDTRYTQRSLNRK